MSVKLLLEHLLEALSLHAYKEAAHARMSHTCQNATLLETTYRG